MRHRSNKRNQDNRADFKVTTPALMEMKRIVEAERAALAEVHLSPVIFFSKEEAGDLSLRLSLEDESGRRQHFFRDVDMALYLREADKRELSPEEKRLARSFRVQHDKGSFHDSFAAGLLGQQHPMEKFRYKVFSMDYALYCNLFGSYLKWSKSTGFIIHVPANAKTVLTQKIADGDLPPLPRLEPLFS